MTSAKAPSSAPAARGKLKQHIYDVDQMTGSRTTSYFQRALRPDVTSRAQGNEMLSNVSKSRSY
jgi:hypothetical protein